MLIRCNLLGESFSSDVVQKRENNPQTLRSIKSGESQESSVVGQQVGDSTALHHPFRGQWLIRWFKSWTTGRGMTLRRRAILAIASGCAFSSLMGGASLYWLEYFTGRQQDQQLLLMKQTPSVDDVRRFRQEQHYVGAMLDYLQLQVNKRQHLEALWQLLVNSALVLHRVEWQEAELKLSLSGKLSAVNELLSKAKMLSGVASVTLLEFRPYHAPHTSTPTHDVGYEGIAHMRMILTDFAAYPSAIGGMSSDSDRGLHDDDRGLHDDSGEISLKRRSSTDAVPVGQHSKTIQFEKRWVRDGANQ